jgi:hypothetical protein
MVLDHLFYFVCCTPNPDEKGTERSFCPTARAAARCRCTPNPDEKGTESRQRYSLRPRAPGSCTPNPDEKGTERPNITHYMLATISVALLTPTKRGLKGFYQNR